ncbi:MAG: DUF2191 domain-containing protein [Nitrospirae bacterium]|nr:MAG: DUF2191 domain-containing protein [Nitrospirota bacterium]
MKTTILLPDSLYMEARKLAEKDNTTLKSLIEEGLHKVIAEHKRKKRFKLKKATFLGKGLQPQFADNNRDNIRNAIYKGRGN